MKRCPMKVREIVSLTKPKITALNIFTAVASFLLAGGNLATMHHLIIAGYFSVGGASALNHVLDADIDGKMRRTAKRPLPAGRIKAKTAFIIGLGMVIFSVSYSVVFLNLVASVFILLGALIYVLVYTLWLKRRSVWNIVIGGAAGSCAPLAGWAATGQELSLLPWLLALLVFLWTPGHFWALASRAVKDYEAAGVPMLPVKYGVVFTSKASLISNLVTVAAALAIAFTISQPILYLLLVAPVSTCLIYESIKPCINYSPQAAWKAFKISSPWLFVVFAAALVANTIA
ncbi:MAG: heme o synthase [Candidatus Caldarchaeum sp.]